MEENSKRLIILKEEENIEIKKDTNIFTKGANQKTIIYAQPSTSRQKCTNFWESDFEFSGEESFESDIQSLDSFDVNILESSFLSIPQVAHNIFHGSEKEKTESLELLISMPVDDLMEQIPWSRFQALLQDVICNKKHSIHKKLLGLRIVLKLVSQHENQRLVCDSFTTLVELAAYLSQQVDWTKDRNDPHIEILIRIVWIIVNIQRSLTKDWIRFNAKRLQDIIFTFIEFLETDLKIKENVLSPLIIVSMVDPKSTWSRYWTHGSTTRTQFCLALKKYKKTFRFIVETVIQGLPSKPTRLMRKTNQIAKVDHGVTEVTERIDLINLNMKRPKKFPETINTYRNERVGDENKSDIHARNRKFPNIHSAPCILHTKPRDTFLSSNHDTQLNNLTSDFITKSLFCQCFSLLTYLIQFKAGRSLFPLQISKKTRQLTLQETLESMIQYILQWKSKESNLLYLEHLSNLLEILESVKETITIVRRAPYHTSRF